MVRKHLDEIRSKEGEARQRILDARAKAGRIVEEAGEEGMKLLEDKRIEGNELKKAMVAGANGKAQARIEELRAAGRSRLGKLEISAAGNRQKALDLIMEAFRKGLRNADVR